MRKEANGWIIETTIVRDSTEFRRMTEKGYRIIEFEDGRESGFVTLARPKGNR